MKIAMEETVSYLDDKLSKIRASGKPRDFLDDIRVMYYGNSVPLNNVANVSVPGAKDHYYYAMGEKCYQKILRRPSWTQTSVLRPKIMESSYVSVCPL